MLLNMVTSFLELSTLITLIDLEPKNRRFSDFWRFLAAKE